MSAHEHSTPLVLAKRRVVQPSTAIAILMLLVLAVVPLVAGGYTLSTFRDIMLLGLFALSLDLFWGRTGILSFDHATFFGLGAYGMAIATTRFGVDPQWASLVGLSVGIGLASLVALIVGYFILYGGVRGAYFTIVTLALTIIAHQTAIGWSSVTGGLRPDRRAALFHTRLQLCRRHTLLLFRARDPRTLSRRGASSDARPRRHHSHSYPG